jgi:hypothetical protein
MYNELLCINIGFRLQSYDIFSKVVSATYGKLAKGTKAQAAKNQQIMKSLT